MVIAIIKRLRGSRLVRNTAWMFLGQGLRTVIQAAYFILIARSLGSRNYGAFVGVCALVAIVSPFAGLGGGSLLIKNVARSAESFGRYWGRALLVLLITGAVLLCVVLGVSGYVFPASIPFMLVLVVSVTDLFFSRAMDICSQAFQAFERLEKTAQILVIPNFLRLAAIAGLGLMVKAPTALQWGYLYLLTTMISLSISLWLVHKELGSPVFLSSGLKGEHAEGFYFSAGLSAQSIYNDIDKTMLTRFSTLSSAGIYSAAYRIIDVSFAPVRSLLYASYARFFRYGEDGIKGSMGFARKVLPVAGGYGVAGGLLLLMAAPLLPVVLGAQYMETAEALRWLAPLPFIKALHYFAADSLTGAGFQGIRSGIQVFVAIFNVAINLWLIPAYSWRGAAWSSLASDGLLALLLWQALFILLHRQRAAEGIAAASGQ